MKNCSIPQLTGMREDVKAKIQAVHDLTDADKAWLVAAIDAVPDTVSAVRLNLHSRDEKGKLTLMLSLSPVF